MSKCTCIDTSGLKVCPWCRENVPDSKVSEKKSAASVQPTSGHTPGPWTVNDKSKKPGKSIYIHGPTTNVIAKLVYRRAAIPKLEDAQLMAAAPELLAVCKRALDEMIKDGTYSRSRVSYDLEDAIDKAEGAPATPGEEK